MSSTGSTFNTTPRADADAPASPSVLSVGGHGGRQPVRCKVSELPPDGLLDLRGLSKRLSLSPRTLRTWIADPERPLPAYRVGGKLLFRWPEVVRWLETFRLNPANAGQMVEDIVQSLGAAGSARRRSRSAQSAKEE